MEFEIIRSSRRSVSLEVTGDGSVLVRCPLYYPEARCRAFVEEKKSWIEKQQQRMQNRVRYSDFTEAEILELKQMAREYLIPKTKQLAEKFGFTYTSVRITTAKKRFGSCSSKNAISYSCFLMLSPKEAVDFVIVHELCHTKEHNHSAHFYRLLERCLPDYRERKNLLQK